MNCKLFVDLRNTGTQEMSTTTRVNNQDFIDENDENVVPFPDKKPEIQLVAGERPRVTDDAFKVVQKSKDLYNYGGKLSYLDGGKAVETSAEFVSDYLGRRINFFAMKPARGGDFERINADTPEWLSKRIIKLAGRKIPELISIITAPTLRPDGSILNKPGYDPDTKLLLLPGAYPDIPENPTMGEVRAAWKVLWFPYSEFPYVTDNDKGTAVASALTAVVRKTLPKAPAFNFDAPMSSSGKTLLASVAQELIGSGFVTPYVGDTEFRKTILAVLRDGYPALLLDNVRGVVDLPVMEAFLTSETWCDRVLATSSMFDGPSRILFLISGNNFQPGADLPRRVCNCRIDPESDTPHTRTFDFSPPIYARQNRQKLVAAALTILRGFLFRKAPKKTADTLGSFDEWDALVRQCVIWLGTEKIAPLGDPVATMDRARQNDPARQRLSAFLKIVHDATNGAPFTAKQLLDKAAGITALDNILLETATHRSSNLFSSKVLGRYLGDRANNHCDGYWLERGTINTGTQEWIVKNVKKSPPKDAS